MTVFEVASGPGLARDLIESLHPMYSVVKSFLRFVSAGLWPCLAPSWLRQYIEHTGCQHFRKEMACIGVQFRPPEVTQSGKVTTIVVI